MYQRSPRRGYAQPSAQMTTPPAEINQPNPQPASPAPVPQNIPRNAPQNTSQAIPQNVPNDVKPPVQPPQQDQQQPVRAKIWKINGSDKVIDFSSKLTKAFKKDYGNIHGCGGKGHAPNSTITMTLCDYTKGTGDKSVTVSYNVDVEDMALLYNAAMQAALGQLSKAPGGSSASNQAVEQMRDQMRNWMKCPMLQDGSVAIPQAELVNWGKYLTDSLNHQPSGSEAMVLYEVQKNNSYAATMQNGKETAPVSQLRISYDASRRYPWTIFISNCVAPINRRSNGATTHNAKNAIDKKEAQISVGALDFLRAMVAVERYVRIWEMRMFDTVNRMSSEFEGYMEQQRQQRRAA